jgi:ferredoxin
MRVRVASDACIGAGNCARSEPTVFAQRDADGVVVLLDPDPPPAQEAAVREAAALCPVAAILLDQPE